MPEIWFYGILVFMKATIELDDDLYRQLKATAALKGKKVRELVEEGVRMVLHSSSTRSRKPRTKTSLPLVRSSRKKPLNIPDDAASRAEMADDLERYAASLRQ
jgi:hypothetical protein